MPPAILNVCVWGAGVGGGEGAGSITAVRTYVRPLSRPSVSGFRVISFENIGLLD